MISEVEIIARFERLDALVLHHWIALGWLKPQHSGTQYLFDETDVARTHLLCDLSFDMQVGEDELAMLLSLVDQLHGTRTLVRAMAAAVKEQPEDVQGAIMTRVRALLAE